MKKISKTDAAYIAGFFDGEGCFLARTSLNCYSPAVAVVQKYPNILYWIQRTLSLGRIHKMSSGSSKLQITISSDIIEFIKLISPYLKIKKEQSDVLLDLCKLRMKKGTGIRLPNKNLNTRMKLAKKLKELKRKESVPLTLTTLPKKLKCPKVPL